jgi:hypothetical protein
MDLELFAPVNWDPTRRIIALLKKAHDEFLDYMIVIYVHQTSDRSTIDPELLAGFVDEVPEDVLEK